MLKARDEKVTRIIELVDECFNYLNFIMTIAGVIGNILMFLVLSRASLAKISMSIYFRALALSSILVNIDAIYMISISRSWLDINFPDYWLMCKLFAFITYVAISASSWFQVAASVDGFLTIVCSTRFRLVRTQKCRLAIAALIFIYSILFNLYQLFHIHMMPIFDPQTNTTSYICNSQQPKGLLIAWYINLAFVPFLIMIVCSFATYRGVIRARPKSLGRIHYSTIHYRDIRFGMTLIVLNFVFLVSFAPFAIVFMFPASWLLSMDRLWFIIIYHSFEFLYNWHFSMNFYMQLGINKLFRRQFIEIFKKPTVSQRES